MKLSRNFKSFIAVLLFCCAPFCLNAQVIFNGDGSSEPGFVSPPEIQKPINISGKILNEKDQTNVVLKEKAHDNSLTYD